LPDSKKDARKTVHKYPEKEDDSYLISYTKHLERKIRTLEAEKQLIDSEKIRLDREVRSLKTELSRMRQPPLLTAQILHHLEDGRIIVKSANRPDFVVVPSKSIPKEDLAPGRLVYLNQRTFSIVEVCSEPEKMPYNAARAWLGENYELEIIEVENWGEIQSDIRGGFFIRLKSLKELKKVAVAYRIPMIFKKNEEYLAVDYDTPLFWYKP
jgi:proteasome regulatory subunit